MLHTNGQSIDVPLALPGVDSKRSYNLDALGNWVDNGLSGSGFAVQSTQECTPGHESRTTNTLNQVASLNGSALTYDAKGNLLTDGNLTYTYDALNRLVELSGTGPDGNTTFGIYTYDALHRRVQKYSSGIVHLLRRNSRSKAELGNPFAK